MNIVSPPAPLVVNPTRARQTRWWHTALWLALGLSVLMLVSAFTLIDAINPAPVQLTVNGTPLVTDLNLGALPPAHKVVLAAVVALVVLIALLVALGSVVVALVALVPIVLLTVALPVLLGGVVLLVVLSPLVLLAWLLWRATRPAQGSTTMPA